MPAHRSEKNRQEGSSFEKIFEDQAKSCGLLVKKNKLTGMYRPGGRVLLEKSNLDFTLASQSGQVGFFDAKSFCGDRFKYSEISEHQLELAVTYNEYAIPSGFVVFFREDRSVYFFSGKQIHSKGPGNSIHMDEGLYLGMFWNFDLGLVLSKK